MKDFCVRLIESRKTSGLSQREVAEEVGITPSAYANYEHGTREPSLKILAIICEVLDVSSDFLLGIEEWF